MAPYPYTQVHSLVNGIIATTVVSLQQGLQVSVTSFATAAGQLGQVILSPMQPKAENVEFNTGQQTLSIDLIFITPQFGFDYGIVACSGRSTDQNGKNENAFSERIAGWQ